MRAAEILHSYLKHATYNYKITTEALYSHTVRPITEFGVAEYTQAGGEARYSLWVVELDDEAYITNNDMCILATYNYESTLLVICSENDALEEMTHYYLVDDHRAVRFVTTLNLLCQRDKMFFTSKDAEISLDGTNEHTWRLIPALVHDDIPRRDYPKYYLQPDKEWALTENIPYIYLPSTWSLNQMRKYIYGNTFLNTEAHRMNKQIREEIAQQRHPDWLDAVAYTLEAINKDALLTDELRRAINAGHEVAIPLAPYAKGGVVNHKENIHKRNTPEPTDKIQPTKSTLLNDACPFITSGRPYERPACSECASHDLCSKVYATKIEAEWVGGQEPVIPNFVDTMHDVYNVYNIHFEPVVPFEDIEIPVVQPFDTFWKEYHPDATMEECHAHYVKAILFHKYNLKFDYKHISPSDKEEYAKAMRDHCNRKEFHCAADDADHTIRLRDAGDKDDNYIYYHRPWMYVVIPNAYSCIAEAVIGKKKVERIERQVIWEYLLNTLKISVEYQYGDGEAVESGDAK